MRKYKYVGDQEGVELVKDRVSYRANEDGVFEVPFEIHRDDFEPVEKPAKTTKEKS